MTGFILSTLCLFRHLYMLEGVISLLLPENDSDTTANIIGQFTKDVVKKQLSHSYCVGVIVENGNLFYHIVEDSPAMLLIVSEIPKMTDSEEYGNLREETELFDKIIVHFLDHGCSAIIIQVSNPEYLVEYFSRSSRRSQSRSSKRYLFLPHSPNLLYENPDTRTIFTMKQMDVLPDLVIAKLVNRDETVIKIELLTHRYAEPNPSNEVLLDMWTPDRGFFTGSNLFPNKLRNLNGKEICVATVPSYPPYTIVENNSTPPVYDGIELRLVKEYGHYLNFTFRVINDDFWWGEVWPNGSGIGMWGSVAMDTATMGFGATYAWLENYPRLDYSLPYCRSSVRCITPQPRQLPGWMTPLLPFSATIWITVGISLLITTVSLYIVTRAIITLSRYETNNLRKYNHHFSTLTDSTIWTVGLLVLQSPPNEKSPQYIPLQHLLTWLMVFYLLINTIYSGGLASVLTIPRFEDPINSVTDLARSDMLWAATTEAWVYSIEEATEPDLAHVTRNFRVMNEEQLLEHAINRDLAFAVERLIGGNYALPSYVNEKTVPYLRAMRADLYSGFPVVNVRKASPFLESLNTLILRLHAGGLLLNYEGQVVREFLSQRVQLVLAQNDQVSTDSGPVTLQIEHVQGPIFFLGFGLLVAFLVFVIEVLKNR